MIRVLFLALFLTACGGGGSDSPSTPTTPGAGGSTDPAKGTRLRTRCEEYTKVIFYADGNGGEYREEFPEDEACGWVDVTVTMVKDEGDRWDPIVLTYEPADVEITAELPEAAEGWARTEIGDGRIELYTTGRQGTTSVGVNTPFTELEWFQIHLRDEPRCVPSNPFNDCLGYNYYGTSKGLIYYGEDDDRIVEWEMGYFIWNGGREDDGIVELFEKGSERWNEVQKTVDRYNEVYEKSGVHVRYVLKEGAVGLAKWSSNPAGLYPIVRSLDLVDVYIGKGNTCPGTCGCAYAGRYFVYNRPGPVGGVSVCDIYADLHEIGHSLGLAHGPDNEKNADSGYIFPDFGHGHSGGILCGADLMSYAGGYTHLNSNITCEEMFSREAGNTDPTGDRTIADAAYHINRIRYDVSLIHCKEDTCSALQEELAPLSMPLDPELVYDRKILVEDKVEDIKDGHRMVIEERARLRRLFGTNREGGRLQEK